MLSARHDAHARERARLAHSGVVLAAARVTLVSALVDLLVARAGSGGQDFDEEGAVAREPEEGVCAEGAGRAAVRGGDIVECYGVGEVRMYFDVAFWCARRRREGGRPCEVLLAGFGILAPSLFVSSMFFALLCEGAGATSAYSSMEGFFGELICGCGGRVFIVF